MASDYLDSIHPVFQPSKPVVTWKWSDLRQAVDFTLQTNYDDDNDVGTYKIECYDLKTGKKVASGKNTIYTIPNTYKGRIYKFRVKQEYTNPNTKKKYYTEWSDYVYALPEAIAFAQRTKAGNISPCEPVSCMVQ